VASRIVVRWYESTSGDGYVVVVVVFVVVTLVLLCLYCLEFLFVADEQL
jgi:hypothetical protein